MALIPVTFNVVDAELARIISAFKFQFSAEIGKVGVETDAAFVKRMVVKSIKDTVKSAESARAFSSGLQAAQTAQTNALNVAPPSIT